MEFSLDSLNIAEDVDVSDFFDTSERQSGSSNELEETTLNSNKLDRVKTNTSSSNDCHAEPQQQDIQKRSSSTPVEKPQPMSRVKKTGENIYDEDSSKTKPTESRDIKQRSPAKYTDQAQLCRGSKETGQMSLATPNLNQRENYRKCHRQTTHTSVSTLCSGGEPHSVDRVASPPSLSPWERWVVHKAHQEKERRKIRRMTKVAEHEQEAEQRLKEQQKQVNAKRCYDEWVARKAELGREKKKEEQQRIAQKIAQDREKQHYLAERASSSFKEWQLVKNRQRKTKEQQSLEECHQKEEKKHEQSAKAEEAYRRWMIAAGRRKIDSDFCSGRTDSPSYCNPHTWKGPLDICQ